MSKIAYIITGMTKEQLGEYDFRRVNSKYDFFYPPQGFVYGAHDSIRINGRLIVGTSDLDSERKRLLKHTPECLKPTLIERVKSLF